MAKRHWKSGKARYLPGAEPARAEQKARDAIGELIGEARLSIVPLPYHLFVTSVFIDYIRPSGKNHVIAFSPRLFEGLGCHVTPLSYEPVGRDLLEPLLTPRTALISVPWACPTSGRLFPIDEIGALCLERGLLLHVEGSGAVGKIAIDLEGSSVDFLTFEAAPMHGPKGIGAIAARRPLTIDEGEVSRPSLIAFGTAAEEARAALDHLCLETARLRSLCYGVGRPLYADEMRLPTVAVIECDGIDPDLMQFALAEEAIFVGRHGERALSISLSRETTEEEVRRLKGAIADHAARYASLAKTGGEGVVTTRLEGALSNKVRERALAPLYGGAHDSDVPSDMRHVVGTVGPLTLSLLVDTSDGVIADARYTLFGGPALVAIADVACELLMRKSYAQGLRITADMVEYALRDFSYEPALPDGAAGLLNTVIDAIEEALSSCSDIPLADPAETPPLTRFGGSGPHPGWELLSSEEKLGVIQRVISEQIQPYIELDAGGIDIISFDDDAVLTISYSGACTTCPSATGATLDAITQILRANVDPSISVKPHF
jgi:NifU-like protein